MSDRELLELAAKAAGIAIQRSRLEDPMWRDMLLVERHKDHSGVAVGWNPLTDDGDRYRLAKKLDIRIHFGPGYVTYEASGICGIVRWPEDECDDARAIVRAAAEVGKSMVK